MPRKGGMPRTASTHVCRRDRRTPASSPLAASASLGARVGLLTPSSARAVALTVTCDTATTVVTPSFPAPLRSLRRNRHCALVTRAAAAVVAASPSSAGLCARRTSTAVEPNVWKRTASPRRLSSPANGRAAGPLRGRHSASVYCSAAWKRAPLTTATAAAAASSLQSWGRASPAGRGAVVSSGPLPATQAAVPRVHAARSTASASRDSCAQTAATSGSRCSGAGDSCWGALPSAASNARATFAVSAPAVPAESGLVHGATHTSCSALLPGTSRSTPVGNGSVGDGRLSSTCTSSNAGSWTGVRKEGPHSAPRSHRAGARAVRCSVVGGHTPWRPWDRVHPRQLRGRGGTRSGAGAPERGPRRLARARGRAV